MPAGMRWAVGVGIGVACALAMAAQSPAAAPQAPAAVSPGAVSAAPVSPGSDQAIAGGKLRGMVKSGSTPLPGVTVTAANSLTGKRYSTTTDINGAWAMTIPQNGRYVIRTQFTAFAPGAGEAVLNATSRDQAVNLDLMLASRAAAQEAKQSGQVAQAIRQLAGSGAQALSLMSSLAAGTDTQSGAVGASGAALPSIAGNQDFNGDSVAVNGQAGTVSPLAGVDMDRLRDAFETFRAQGGGAGGNFGGGGFGGPGGFGGMGGFGGGRMNFRAFKPGQPHGAIFWTGSNSGLDAQPFALRGQSQDQPASGTNRFGLTFIGAPYIPGRTKPSGKDTVFLTLSGQRSSAPLDEYATVPTAAERAGKIPGLAAPITPVPQAVALLKYFPLPNLPGDVQNYHLLSTSQSNSTLAGVRYMRSLGANASPFGGLGGGRRGQSTSQGLRQSLNFNYNWSHAAQDDVNIFPELGGKGSTGSNSLTAGYTLGYGKLTSIFNASWNRSNARTTNFFTNGEDAATNAGILGPGGTALNASPLNYGVPGVALSNLTGLSEQQPNFALTQTVSVSETLSWIHAKHNFRFGGDYRRVHRDILGSSNATGMFYFTGVYTGSPLGDFLLGKPQETSLDAALSKAYLRDNVFDVYAQDDWRALQWLTVNYGLRYEYFAPYTEKDNRLAFVDANPSQGFTHLTEARAGAGQPGSLVDPSRVAFAPRVSVAVRLPKQTVIRAGFGMNYTVGQYAGFATTLAHQPPFANEQTNEATQCATAADCLSLANGFPAPATLGNYALDAHYKLPYIEVWNLDVQKTLPWGVVMNLGYNGSKGNHLDNTIAPRAVPGSPNTDPGNHVFNYEQSAASSKYSAGTLRVNKRLSSGIAVGANYTYSHSIDDAGALGGISTVVAQNWQNLAADEGNSGLDQRHKVTGTYLYELPFGKDKFWITSGTASHILEGLSVSGSYTFATGTPLNPTYQAAASSVACGTAGSLRPDLTGKPVDAGGSLREWFNPAAYTAPVPANSQYPCAIYGNAPRNSIAGPGTIENNMSLSKTLQLGDTRSIEIRATASNVFNTVQYSGVDTNVDSPTFGQVNLTASMRAFNFMARFRF